jgi:hypothetical protein
MSIQRILPVLILVSLAPSLAGGQTSYPMLMSLDPVAVQAGQTAEHTLRSRYSMLGATQVFISGEGVTGEIVPPEVKDEDKDKPLESLTVRFTAAPDAKLGVRDFRLITPQGASTVGQLVVVRDVVVSESNDNNTADKAQAIPVPSVACGAIEKAEDVDFFKFSVEAGAALTFHVRAMRLQDRIHDLQQHADPILTLRNSAGVTLAASDNYFFGDPLIAHQFPEAGEYLLEIRDVRYEGNAHWRYSIEISNRPFVTNVYPMGVAPGVETSLELTGWGLPQGATSLFTPPADSPRGLAWLSLPLGNDSTNPAPLVVSDLPLVQKAAGEENAAGAAQSISIPAGVNGRIEAEGDIDCYAFEAKKGERYSFEVIARRQQSALDSHLRILDENGKQLQLNDDLQLGKRNFEDSWIEFWAPPADGVYVVEVRDLHLRGGPDFVYFLRATRSEPYFELYVDTDKTQLTPGTCGAVFVRVVRKNGFQGEVQLAVEGLPPGVTAECGRILAGKRQDGCIVLSAAPDAPQGAANIIIRGTAMHEEEGQTRELTAVASPYQETYQPGGGRGHWPVEMHTVAVGAPSDIRSVTLNTHEIALKPGESKPIEVTIERAEGFDKNVTLDVIYQHLSSVYGDSLPEGVTLDASQSKTLLTGAATQGQITLKAAPDAPATPKQLVPVMANVSINFVMKTTFAAGPLWVSVEK